MFAVRTSILRQVLLDVSVIGMPQRCHFYPCKYIEQIVAEFGSALLTIHNVIGCFLAAILYVWYTNSHSQKSKQHKLKQKI